MVSKQFLIEFIEILRRENAIWQVKSDKYKNKVEREKAWQKLLSKCREYDKSATIDMAKKKYHGIRTCYRRELEKIKKSAISGAESDELYVPSLWYFNRLHFLQDQETQLDGIDTIDDSIEEEIEKEIQPPQSKKRKTDNSADELLRLEIQPPQPKRENNNSADELLPLEIQPPQPKKKKSNNSADELLRLVTKRLKSPQGSSHHLGIAWGDKLSKMNRNQRIIAEKIVNEVMFNGELGLLNFNTSLTNLSSTSNLNQASFELNKNDAIVHSYGESSLDSTPPTNNINIQRQVNTYSPPSGIDESTTDHEQDLSERNFVVLECDPLNGSVKMED